MNKLEKICKHSKVKAKFNNNTQQLTEGHECKLGEGLCITTEIEFDKAKDIDIYKPTYEKMKDCPCYKPLKEKTIEFGYNKGGFCK